MAKRKRGKPWPVAYRKKKRNERILKRYLDGEPLRDIAARYGLIDATVCRIARAMGAPPRPRGVPPSPDVIFVCPVCGGEKVMREAEAVKRKVCSRACALPRKPRTYTDDELATAFRNLAQRLGHTPTYKQLREYGPPDPDTIIRRFGNLREAARYAGLVPNPAGWPDSRNTGRPRGPTVIRERLPCRGQ